MPTHLSKLAALIAGASAIAVVPLAPSHAETVKLTILGVGDIYNFVGLKDFGRIRPSERRCQGREGEQP